ncbi:MAG: thermonuclease family protein [bacterium]|nr:thermonuclease family protein [bacterium]
MRRTHSLLWWLSALLVPLIFAGCQSKELDQDGGYFNEKTGRYVYVRPKKMVPKDYKGAVRQPREGQPQMIKARVAKIDADLHSLWLHFEERQSYQIVAETLARRNRDDKDRNLRVLIKFVSPLASVDEVAFRKRWQEYTTQVLETQLLNREVLAEVHYQPKSKQLEAYVTMEVSDESGARILRNINKWMIYQGLSYFFMEDADPPEIKEYSQAQSLAKERRAGLWNYQ